MAKEDYLKNNNFYAGADYGLDSKYGDEWSVGFQYGKSVPAGDFGVATDVRTANQLDAVSKKLSTGAKTIEVSAIQAQLLEAMPKQHMKEIGRLKKLVGADLTFHGPLVEPTGIGQSGWDSSLREQAERQIWSALERSHDMEPKGNIVVTFHSSNGLPEPRTRVKTEKGEEVSTALQVVDERTGRFGALPKPTKDYLTGEAPTVDAELKRLNKQNWTTELTNVNVDISRARNAFQDVDRILRSEDAKKELGGLDPTKLFRMSGTAQGQKFLNSLQPEARKLAEGIIDDMSYANVFARDSYTRLQELFSRAYDAAQRTGNEEDLGKLNKLRDEVLPVIKEYEQDPSNVIKVTETVSKSMRVFDTIKTPQTFRPLEEFAVDKASETFSNVALKAFKKFGDTAPIISVENPPVGMGLSRAEDLKKLVEASREKFAEKLVEKEGLSRGAARKQAEKLIGATWDVGHINMIRKYGYEDKDVVKETEKIAPFVKHIHLSDNFGLEHTELPMGMGNVPTKKMLEAIGKYNKALKKIIETGNWYGPQAFGNATPLRETFRAFGSPIYAMSMGPTWKQYSNSSGGYFVGYGQTLPDQHFNIYGSGFSNLPSELGGQMSGRSRLGGGTPME